MPQQQDYKKQIEEIHAVLVGNQYHKEGLIEKVGRHDKTLKNHSNNFKILTGLGILVAGFVTFFNNITGIFK